MSAAQAPSPAGLWTTYDDATGKPAGRVRIEEAGGEFLGTVVAVLSSEDPDPACERCEGALRGRPVLGMTILRGLRRDGDGFTGGSLLDPDDGRTYRCTMRLEEGGRRLLVRGYVGVPLLGRTQTWVRAD